MLGESAPQRKMKGIQDQMKAVFYECTGPAAEVLRLGLLPLPQRRPGEVLVRIAFASINPMDWKLREARNPKW